MRLDVTNLPTWQKSSPRHTIGFVVARSVTLLVVLASSASCGLLAGLDAYGSSNAGGGGALQGGGGLSELGGGGAGGADPQPSSCGFATGSAALAEGVVEDEPMAYWRFDEPSGAPLDEVTVASLGLMENGASLGPPGMFASGGAARFSPEGHFRVPDDEKSFDFANGASFSIEVWLCLDGWPTGSAGLVFRQKDQNGYRLTIQADGRVAFARKTVDATDTAASAAPMQLGEWTHVVATYDGTSDLMLVYVNGDEAGSAASSSTWLPSQVDLHVGINPNGGGEPAVDGLVDEVAIYLGVLEPSRVAMHWQAVTPAR